MEFLSLAGGVCITTAVLMGLHWFALLVRADLAVKTLLGRNSRRRITLNCVTVIFVGFASALVCGFIISGSSVSEWSEGSAMAAIIGLLSACAHFFLLWLGFNGTLDKQRATPGWQHWLDGDAEKKYEIVMHTACVHATAYQAAWISAASMFISIGMRDELGTTPRWSALMGVEAIAVAVVFPWLVHTVVTRWRSGPRLVTACFADWFDLPKGGGPELKVDRWRNGSHRQMFQVATAIERSLPPLRRRLSTSDFQKLAGSYVRLASTIRGESIRLENVRFRMNVLLWPAVALVVNDDPVRSARRLTKVIAVDDELIEIPTYSRLKKLAVGVNQVIEAAMKPVVVLAVVAIVGYYLAVGKPDSLLQFVRSMLGAP